MFERVSMLYFQISSQFGRSFCSNIGKISFSCTRNLQLFSSFSANLVVEVKFREKSFQAMLNFYGCGRFQILRNIENRKMFERVLLHFQIPSYQIYSFISFRCKGRKICFFLAKNLEPFFKVHYEEGASFSHVSHRSKFLTPSWNSRREFHGVRQEFFRIHRIWMFESSGFDFHERTALFTSSVAISFRDVLFKKAEPWLIFTA